MVVDAADTEVPTLAASGPTRDLEAAKTAFKSGDATASRAAHSAAPHFGMVSKFSPEKHGGYVGVAVVCCCRCAPVLCSLGRLGLLARLNAVGCTLHAPVFSLNRYITCCVSAALALISCEA